MSFPTLQMLAEVSKNASMDDMDGDLDMDMEVDTSMEKDDMPPAAAPVVDMTAVLKFLEDCGAECRKEVHVELMKMVEADKAAE